MTPSQSLRVAGFNASLTTRGVLLSLDGSTATFPALLEDTGKLNSDFEVVKDDRMFGRLHILRTTPNLDLLTADSVLIEVDPTTLEPLGREFTVTTKEPHDIKIVYGCTISHADESPNE